MNILIANPGSTSYKTKLIDQDTGQILFVSAIERIGDHNGIYSFRVGNSALVKRETSIPDYDAAIRLTVNALNEHFLLDKVDCVGFKVVLAKNVTGCVEITDDVLGAIEEYIPLAPVHNLIYLTAINAFKKLLPGLPLVALFETAFHSQIPEEVACYGTPYEWRKKYGFRKYGFHGASHRYISEKTRELYFAGKDQVRMISCHLGGSSSVCAIRDGISVDTSMGMSPQSGLINAKRVGDLDPFGLLYIMEREGFSIDGMRDVLINKSGLLGLSGISADLRDVEAAMHAGNEQAKIAFNAFAYSVRRYIGEYLAVLNGADAIAFTAGIGEHSATMRHRIVANMENLGIVLDPEKNQAPGSDGVISATGSQVLIVVLPTNEELIVGREVARFMERKKISC